jgi:pyruvate-ferredoxin/flavodoxin oxidoreductase
MTERRMITVDGNEAVARVAHKINEVIAIYPITPASPMGELSDQYSVQGRPNIWGTVPDVVEMQSEAGAAAALHGSLQAGSLTTTFTASQGLLLMIPNLYKVAGELTPTVIHVAARTVATHALSIFGDHSDVMACRQTGFALLASGSVQEAHDFALISQEASLQSRVPFIHFFDGFRTSHEVSKIHELSDEDLAAMIDTDRIREHRDRKLTPDAPVLRGTAQNPDVFFQAREAANLYYDRCPELVAEAMERFAKQTGRQYGLFDYFGHPEAERVIVMMGSGAETAQDTVEALAAQGEKIGLIKVRLYRPFARGAFLATLPKTCKSIAVLDRTKEPGAPGDPLYLDVVTTLSEAQQLGDSPLAVAPRIIAGRYGLSSKEFTPAMIKAVYDEIAKDEPKNHFTIGIKDDVTHTSLDWDDNWDLEQEGTVQAIFFGLGSDGTVGANKNSIKIIGEETESWAQGYFVYDSKKSGAITVSHLRFGPKPIRGTYLVRKASFVACHQWSFIEKYDLLENAAEGATLLLNSPHSPTELWDTLPKQMQEHPREESQALHDRRLRGRQRDRHGRAHQHDHADVLLCDLRRAAARRGDRQDQGSDPQDLRPARRRSRAPQLRRGRRHAGPSARSRSDGQDGELAAHASADRQRTRAGLHPERHRDDDGRQGRPAPGQRLPGRRHLGHRHDQVGEAQHRDDRPDLGSRGLHPVQPVRLRLPARGDPRQGLRAERAGQRAGELPLDRLQGQGLPRLEVHDPGGSGGLHRLRLCVQICPAKDKSNPKHKAINMDPSTARSWSASGSTSTSSSICRRSTARRSAAWTPRARSCSSRSSSSAAPARAAARRRTSSCSQLFGDRMLIANATGCSSIYGGNLPTTPWAQERDGRGPAWSNSLFEDNAEFGFGMRLAVDKQRKQARRARHAKLAPAVGDDLVTGLLQGDQSTQAEHRRAARARRCARSRSSRNASTAKRRPPRDLAKTSCRRASGSSAATAGPTTSATAASTTCSAWGATSTCSCSIPRSTPTPAVRPPRRRRSVRQPSSPSAGKQIAKKDLGQEAMAFGGVYVARIGFGANYNQTVKAFQEAESYPGTSLIIAYSPCIAHGYDLKYGVDQTKLAVESGIWPLYRYDPRREKQDPERYRMLAQSAQEAARRQYALYEQLAQLRRDLPEDGNGKQEAE